MSITHNKMFETKNPNNLLIHTQTPTHTHRINYKFAFGGTFYYD